MSSDQLPYYAVIFTSTRTEVNEGYNETNDLLMNKAKDYPGFMGLDAVRDGLGIAVSYWKNLEELHKWKVDTEHILAKSRGRAEWDSHYRIRIARVEMDYQFDKD